MTAHASRDNIQQRMSDLCEDINRHNHLYYVMARPEMTDREYDSLYKELEDLEKQYPEYTAPDSPTCRVGGKPLAEFRHLGHIAPMMSLSNTYSKDELLQFDRRTRDMIKGRSLTYILEPKIDGAAISLRYEHGILTAGATRGDGITGDDITLNLKTIKSIPLKLITNTPPALLEVRGEVFMTKSGFIQINANRIENGEEIFANPRNAAAGSLKLLDSGIVAKRHLDAILYSVGATEGISFVTHEELIKSLSSLGFRTTPKYWHCTDIDSTLRSLDDLEIMRHDFDFEIDGGVIKVNERSFYNTLGATAKSPRYAVAFKYEPERAETRINSITIQVGRTGVLTPVAELEPVLLAGSTVSRATLHNAEEIKRKDIREGDLVLIEKAGEIIPAVLKVVASSRTGAEKEFKMPSSCPVCGGSVSRKEDEVALRCDNLQCPAQIKSWIKHFSARGAMDIDGLGESLIDQLVDKGLVSRPPDIYKLTEQDVENLERMASKSARNLLQGIEASKDRDFWRVIFGLGIRHVGSKSAQTLEKHFSSINELMAANPETLERIADIGPVVAASIVNFFSNSANRDMITSLVDAGISMHSKRTSHGGSLNGMTFVLTGTLMSMTRDEASEQIRTQGGTTSSSVSKKTSYLVIGDSPGSKLQKAMKLGVNVITEEDLRQLLQLNNPVNPSAAE